MKHLVYIFLILVMSCGSQKPSEARLAVNAPPQKHITTKAYISPYQTVYTNTISFKEKKPLFIAKGSKLIVNGFVFGYPDIVFIGRATDEPATIVVNGCMEFEFTSFANVIVEFNEADCDEQIYNNNNATADDYKTIANTFYEMHKNSHAIVKRDGKVIYIGIIDAIWYKMVHDHSANKNYEVIIGNDTYILTL